MKYAHYGYTYQDRIAILFISKMDVERELDQIEIEADATHQFDDLILTMKEGKYYCQIKDLENISLDKICIDNNNTIKIDGKLHKLSDEINILFFKRIQIEPNSEIFGIPSFEFNNVHIISLNRSGTDELISKLYHHNVPRREEIQSFYDTCLDARKLLVKRVDLPTINIFNTELIERTIDIGKKHLKVNNLLTIEGKPGVGKSHYVNCLKKEYPNCEIYRFWISSQDKDYSDRLKYRNFISDFSKKLFQDQVHRSEEDIIDKLAENRNIVIIDGLDHVENYNNSELENYIEFVDKLKTKCKTIVLTRPLVRKLEWEKVSLTNWNNTQTENVLKELFHITDYQVINEIYSITDGYPILVKYVANHFKVHNVIPQLSKLNSVDDFYGELINHEKGKHALALFLCSRSFFMKSEIESLLEKESYGYVKEFIDEHPYLFDIRLNRISLYHDSFITYLRKQNIDYSDHLEIINNAVSSSILNAEKRFLSRYSSFDLDIEIKREIIKKFSSIKEFKKLVKGAIDFEAIQSFYIQLRETLSDIKPDDLELINYYDLSLIMNIVHRDQVSTNNPFLYTYIKCLHFNGYSDDDITSSYYLFGMYYFYHTGDGTLLFNSTNNDLYDTRGFYENLLGDKMEEDSFFEQHSKSPTKQEIKKILAYNTEYDTQKAITYLLEDLFIHSKNRKDFKRLYEIINGYMIRENRGSTARLESFLRQKKIRNFYASWMLKDAKRNIHALGRSPETNNYLKLNLNDFIKKNSELSSFDMWTEILNFIRLSLHLEKKIDISSISSFWTKYYSRKDYSFISLYACLKVFEERKFLSQKESIELINTIQDKSEKGYRGLLSDYIEQYPPSTIISYLVDNFEIENLSVSWFLLPPAYIDVFPDKIYNLEIRNQLGYHHSTGEIDYDDIANVLKSNRKKQLETDLNFFKYKVRIKDTDDQLAELKRTSLQIREYRDENIYKYKSDSQSNYEKGILTVRDKEFILEKNLSSLEISGYSDGNYSGLADLTLYELFDKEDIRKNIKSIIYNAMLGKTKGINAFYDLYHFPGHLPKLIADFDLKIDFKKLFESFKIFLELSMFEISIEVEK